MVNKMNEGTLTDYERAILNKLNYLIEKDKQRSDLSDLCAEQSKELEKLRGIQMDYHMLRRHFNQLKNTALYWHSLLREDQPRYRTPQDKDFSTLP